MKTLFNVTYDIVTPESAENGEAAESGFVDQNLSLRDAITELHLTRTNLCDGTECIEPSESRGRPRWITVVNGQEYLTGAQESRALHIPCKVSDSSAIRIARLCGVTYAQN